MRSSQWLVSGGVLTLTLEWLLPNVCGHWSECQCVGTSGAGNTRCQPNTTSSWRRRRRWQGRPRPHPRMQRNQLAAKKKSVFVRSAPVGKWDLLRVEQCQHLCMVMTQPWAGTHCHQVTILRFILSPVTSHQAIIFNNLWDDVITTQHHKAWQMIVCLSCSLAPSVEIKSEFSFECNRKWQQPCHHRVRIVSTLLYISIMDHTCIEMQMWSKHTQNIHDFVLFSASVSSWLMRMTAWNCKCEYLP